MFCCGALVERSLVFGGALEVELVVSTRVGDGLEGTEAVGRIQRFS